MIDLKNVAVKIDANEVHKYPGALGKFVDALVSDFGVISHRTVWLDIGESFCWSSEGESDYSALYVDSDGVLDLLEDGVPLDRDVLSLRELDALMRVFERESQFLEMSTDDLVDFVKCAQEEISRRSREK